LFQAASVEEPRARSILKVASPMHIINQGALSAVGRIEDVLVAWLLQNHDW
jgi:hypothetical protein